jgi:flagellar hook-associated protein 2
MSALNEAVNGLIDAENGAFARKIKSSEGQVELLNDRIAKIDERMELRRASLMKQFYDMEIALGELNAQGQNLTNQLANTNANWGGGSSSS